MLCSLLRFTVAVLIVTNKEPNVLVLIIQHLVTRRTSFSRYICRRMLCNLVLVITQLSLFSCAFSLLLSASLWVCLYLLLLQLVCSNVNHKDYNSVVASLLCLLLP